MLIIVGYLMMTTLGEGINVSAVEVGPPGLRTLAGMPLTYSIANGIGAGVEAHDPVDGLGSDLAGLEEHGGSFEVEDLVLARPVTRADDGRVDGQAAVLEASILAVDRLRPRLVVVLMRLQEDERDRQHNLTSTTLRALNDSVGANDERRLALSLGPELPSSGSQEGERNDAR